MVSNEGLGHDFGTSSDSDVALHHQTADGSSHQGSDSRERDQYEYDILSLKGQRYLCRIPQVEQTYPEETNTTISKFDQEKELARANEKGWDLLKGMQGNCIYFWSGWWSYRYCYGEGVKQFHQLPPRQGIPAYPPVEDPGVVGFMLGQVEKSKTDEKGLQESKGAKTAGDTTKVVGELEARGDIRYLVQKLGGGTTCDLTGKDRKIEIQVCV